MHVRSIVPSFRRALLTIALALLACLLLAPSALAEDSFIEPIEVANTAGRLDTASLYDLGDNTAALYAFVSDNAVFSRIRLWKSSVGAFDTAKAKLACGDLNADGKPDVLVLYDKGSGVSALYAFLSAGTKYVKTTAWKGTLTWSRAKLCVADIDGDGADDAYVFYKTGLETASVQGFFSTVSDVQTSGVNKIVMTKKRLWPAAYYLWDRAKVAATDVDGDGRDDLVSLYRSSLTTARLDVFHSSGTAVAKERWWKGDFKAAKSKFACGDLDSDGKGDAFVLYDRGDASSSLRVFTSTGTLFAAPKTWWKSAIGALNWWTTKLACGDVTSDGKADAVLLSKKSLTECRVRVATSTGSAFTVKSWWVGSYRYGRATIACAPSTPLVIPETTKVLDPVVVAGMSTADGETFTFADPAQTADLAPGDVIVGEPCSEFPEGLMRKVVSVDGVTVTTEHAFLEDALASGEFAFEQTLVRGELAETVSATAGVVIASAGLTSDGSGLVTLQLTDVPICTGIDLGASFPLATLSGTITLDVTLALNCEWDTRAPRTPPCRSVAMTTATVVECDLEAVVDAGFTGDWTSSRELPVELPPIVVDAGVPLCFRPQLTVVVGIDGTCESPITLGGEFEASVPVGVSYGPDGWRLERGSVGSVQSAVLSAPGSSDSVELRVDSEIGLDLYGSDASEVGTGAVFAYEPVSFEHPWWTYALVHEGYAHWPAGATIGWLRFDADWISPPTSLQETVLVEAETAAPVVVGAEFPASEPVAHQRDPAVSGDLVVWADYRNSPYILVGGDIYGRDLTSDHDIPICTADGEQRDPDVSGDIVVWQDFRSDELGDIYGYDLSSGTEFPICTGAAEQSEPAISGDIVVWSDLRNGNYDIYGYDLAEGREFPVCVNTSWQLEPDISGSVVVWRDKRNDNWRLYLYENWDIFGCDLVSKIEFPICTNVYYQEDPSVSGDIVVWEDRRIYPARVFVYDLSERREFAVTTSGTQTNPKVSGNMIIWAEKRYLTNDVYGFDLATFTEVAICTDDGSQQDVPEVSGDTVVWMDNRVTAVYHIYAADMTR